MSMTPSSHVSPENSEKELRSSREMKRSKSKMSTNSLSSTLKNFFQAKNKENSLKYISQSVQISVSSTLWRKAMPCYCKELKLKEAWNWFIGFW